MGRPLDSSSRGAGRADTRTGYLRVAQLAAHVLWEHGGGSSNLCAETNDRHGACGAAAALRDVTPAVVGSNPTTHPSAWGPIGATARRSGLKSRGRRACRFEACIGHQQHNPSWRNWQTHRSQKPGPTGMSVRVGPRGPLPRPPGETGRRAASRALCRKASRFDPGGGHHVLRTRGSGHVPARERAVVRAGPHGPSFTSLGAFPWNS